MEEPKDNNEEKLDEEHKEPKEEKEEKEEEKEEEKNNSEANKKDDDNQEPDLPKTPKGNKKQEKEIEPETAEEKKEKKKKEKEKLKKEKQEKKEKLKQEKLEKKEKLKQEKLEKAKKKEEEKAKKLEEQKHKKEDEKEKINIIYTIDEGNNKCVDCDSEHPTKISINNGVIICEECAKKHKNLGSSISFIKNIDDNLDNFLFDFIVLGGNTKFKRFLNEEKINLELPIEEKYKTEACNFYRKNLKAKVKGEKEIEKNYTSANDIVQESENIFPEFDNYKLKNEVIRKGTLQNQNKSQFLNIFRMFGKGERNKANAKRNKKLKNDPNFTQHEYKNDDEDDINKTAPNAPKKDNLESRRPLYEDKKDENNEGVKEQITSNLPNKEK